MGNLSLVLWSVELVESFFAWIATPVIVFELENSFTKMASSQFSMFTGMSIKAESTI